jgi:hypothetical protein
MHADTTKTWAKRAMLLGLSLFAVGFLATVLAMQHAFAAAASEDQTNKARLLAEAVVKAKRIESVTRFTSPLGLVLFVGGTGTLIVLRFRGSPSVGPSGDECDDDKDR